MKVVLRTPDEWTQTNPKALQPGHIHCGAGQLLAEVDDIRLRARLTHPGQT